MTDKATPLASQNAMGEYTKPPFTMGEFNNIGRNQWVLKEDKIFAEVYGEHNTNIQANASFVLHAVNNIDRITEQRDELLTKLKFASDTLINIVHGSNGIFKPVPKEVVIDVIEQCTLAISSAEKGE